MSALDHISTAVQTRLSTLATQAEPHLAPLMARYRELQPRERLIVALGAAVLALTLIYLLLWEPFAKAHERQQAALTEQRALAERLETIGVVVQRARASGLGAVQGGGQSLLTLVDQAARLPELGKAPTRLQPDGETEVKIWFEDVPFDNLARWIGILQSRYGVSVSGAEIERRASAGLVNARLSLVRP
ncbi:type II secretion system protein M [Stagnimonas aquatica]|uniref:Type II secretion system protein M n=1 Tax=Stagnimonas aquatica TaxID=2689987 RepID=A0A3N0VA02_9GAMM|nr:type II secretion system protein M [Stagnimonas aquatica]ROH89613.1 type II secretion system protein M [Stagnimonas aquatica]